MMETENGVVRNMKKPHIVILGAGYGGMMTAAKLQKSMKANEAVITLVNNNDYHYQTTWLHENAAGTLHHERTKIKIKDVIDSRKIELVLDEVICIKPEEKLVKLAKQELTYDYLVIGLGFEPATFGIPGLEENSFSIGNINNARAIREHLDYNFASYHNESEKNAARLNIVIGGGGFTGIEFAGELANRIPQLCKEYDIEKTQVRLIVLEGASTVLPGFDEKLVAYAMNSLASRGVEFINEALLQECNSDSIVFEKDGKRTELPTMTTIWAAGIRANTVVEKSGFRTNSGKVEVQSDMSTPDFDDVFVIGDCSLILDHDTGRPLPSTAQIAIQQAEIVAHNVKAKVRGWKLKTFVPNPLGTIASLGNDDAIAVVSGRRLFGWKASVMKKMSDNRYLLKLGGLGLLMRKGKFNFFY